MTVGSATIPGVRQDVRVQRGPSEPGANERILLIGYRRSTADDGFDLVPQPMVSADDAIDVFGEGAQLALMVRGAFAVGPVARNDQTRGFLPEIWAMAVPPPVGTPASNTLTWTGPATANAQIPVEVGNERAILQVLSGDTADDIAAKADALLQALQRNLPFTSSSALAVTTLDARDDGEFANELFIWADVRRAPGVGVTIARAADGVGVVDLTAALLASEGGDWAGIALPQQDTATRDSIKLHIQKMWDQDTQRRRRVYMPQGGLLTAAATDAQAIQDWRACVVSVERRPGVGMPWDPAHSARSFSWEASAVMVARMESQAIGWNFNQHRTPLRGRPEDTLTGAEYDAAHNAGVSIILDNRITDPISAATTDQTGVTNAPDLSLLPLEIPRTVRAIAAELAIKLAGFSQAESRADTTTRINIQSATLSVFTDAAGRGWIQSVSDADITVTFVPEGGSTVAVVSVIYMVIVGLDIVRVEHLVQV